MEDARHGDFGLVSSILSNITDRLLYQSIPNEMKREASETFIGKDLYVIQMIKETFEKTYETVDEIEAYMMYNEWCRDPEGTITNNRTTIEGGNEVDGWQYTLEDAELIQSRYDESQEISTEHFKADLKIAIEGTVIKGTDREYIREAIIAEMKPIFVSPEFVETSAKINEINLEI